MLKELLWILTGVTPFCVDKILRDNVEVNIAFKNLYGFEIVSNVERIKHIGKETISKILSISTPSPNKVLYMVVNKFKVNNEFVSRVFYFSYNKELLGILAENFGSNNVEFLSGPRLASVLYKLHALYPFYVKNKSGLVVKTKDIFTNDDVDVIVRDRFSNLMREIDIDSKRVFVGANVSASSRLEGLFKADWQGSIYLIFDFNDPSLVLRNKKDQSIQHRKTFKQMEDMSKQGIKQYIGVLAHFVTDTKLMGEVSFDKMIELFYAVGFSPIAKKNFKDLYVLSPFYVRDDDFTFYLTADEVKDLLFYSYEKTYYPPDPDFFGTNSHGGYTSYSLSEENNNPHALVFAPSGSGKSFGMQNMLTNMLRVNVEDLLKGSVDKQKLRSARVRYFDKGFSAELLFKLMEKRGYDVSLFKARTDEITLNPADIREDSTEEYEFSLYITNACLTAIGMPPLQEYEANWYKRVLKQVYQNKEYRAFLGKNLLALNIPALEKVYNKLLSYGYDPYNTRIGDIKEQEFNFLKAPLLTDVIRVLSNYQDDTSLTHADKEGIKNAISKLKALTDYPQLIYPTQVSLSESDILYIDYEFLSSTTFFVPILLTIIKRLTYYDKFFKKEDMYAYYIIDEAHNLLRNEYFNLALKILIREARKYRISLIFLTQNFEEVPPDIITNTDTIMFISPQEEERRRQYITSFYRHIKVDPNTQGETDLEYIYYRTPAYTFTVWYSRGVFSVRFPVDKYKLQLFDSYRKELTTEDGLVIKKSLVLGEV